MTTRRRFTADFKAKVALETLRGDRTVQGEEELKTIRGIVFPTNAAKHRVHPSQVSTWKRQAIDGLGEVFSNGVDRARSGHEAKARYYAQIEELAMVA